MTDMTDMTGMIDIIDLTKNLNELPSFANPDDLLYYALVTNNVDDIKKALEQGADINKLGLHGTPLSMAITCTESDEKKEIIVNMLLEHGALVNLPYNYNMLMYALHVAVRFGHVYIVHILLKHGADVNAKDCNQNTALQVAADWGYCDIIEMLLLCGANINHRNKKGYTALSIAVRNNHIGAVKLLLQMGASVHIPNECLEFPIHMIYINSLIGKKRKVMLEILELLIRYGANINAINKLGQTILSRFCSTHIFPEIVLELLNYGANVNIINKEIVSLLHAAILNKSIQIIRYLLQFGVDINYRSPTGTALIYSIKTDLPDATKILLENGANVKIQDFEGKTALHYA